MVWPNWKSSSFNRLTSTFQLFYFSTFAFLGRKVESFLTIVRSKTSTFRLFEVTFLLEKWKLVCLISTFRVPRRSKSGWRKQDSVGWWIMEHSESFTALPGWLSVEGVGLITWWLWVWSLGEATFLSGVFSPLTSAKACEKSSWWL